MSGDDDFAGHSKAPWHYSPTHYGKAFAIGAADGDNVALVYGPEENGSDFFRANARLIASAPSLLAENQRLRAQVAGLREALEHLEDAASCVAATFGHIREDYPERGAIFTHEGHTEAYLLDTINEARAAVASAEDRT